MVAKVVDWSLASGAVGALALASRDTVGDAVGFAPNCGSVNPKTTKRALRLESGFVVLHFNMRKLCAAGGVRGFLVFLQERQDCDNMHPAL